MSWNLIFSTNAIANNGEGEGLRDLVACMTSGGWRVDTWDNVAIKVSQSLACIM